MWERDSHGWKFKLAGPAVVGQWTIVCSAERIVGLIFALVSGQF